MRNTEAAIKIVTKDKENGKYPILSNQFYDSSMSECQTLLEKFDNVKIPQNIPRKRRVLLQNYIYYNQLLIEKLNIQQLEIAKECHGSESCFFNKLSGNNPYEIGLYMLQRLDTKIHAQEKLSIKYFLCYPLILIFEFDIKRTEKEEKNYLNKKKVPFKKADNTRSLLY